MLGVFLPQPVYSTSIHLSSPIRSCGVFIYISRKLMRIKGFLVCFFFLCTIANWNHILNILQQSAGTMACVCVCIYIYIYIYIYFVIQRQTVSFYQNSSGWLDRLDSRSWDRNLPDWNANPRFYHSATRKPAQAKEI